MKYKMRFHYFEFFIHTFSRFSCVYYLNPSYLIIFLHTVSLFNTFYSLLISLFINNLFPHTLNQRTVRSLYFFLPQHFIISHCVIKLKVFQ
jgi:hypothetical protein